MSPGSGKRRRHPVAKVKGGWTSEEDAVLISLVHEYGEGNWSPIAKALNEAFNKTADNGRIGKQCRERWNHHLRPDIKKDAWTEEEELLLVTAHKSVGNKWSDIARQLPGRTENAVKNHWNATLRRKDTAAAPEGAPQVLRAYMLGLGLLGAGGRGGRNRKRKARDSSEDSADPAWRPYSWGPGEGAPSGGGGEEADCVVTGPPGATTSSGLAAGTQHHHHHQQARRAGSKRVCSSSRLDQVLAAAAACSSEGSPCGDTSSCSSGEQGSRPAQAPAAPAGVRLGPPPAGVIKLEPGVCTLEPPLTSRGPATAEAAEAGTGLHRSRTYVSLPTLTRQGAGGGPAAAAPEEGAAAAAGVRRSSGRLAAAAAGYCGSSADLEDLLSCRTGSSRNLTAAAAAAAAVEALGGGGLAAGAAAAAAGRGGGGTGGERGHLGCYSSSRASLAPLEAGGRAAGPPCAPAQPPQQLAAVDHSSLMEQPALPAGEGLNARPTPAAALDTCAAAAAAAVAGEQEQPAVYPSADLDDTLAWVQSMDQEPVLFEELMSASGPVVEAQDLNQVLDAPPGPAAGGDASTSTASHPALCRDQGDLLVAAASPRGTVVDSLLLPHSCSSTQLSSYTVAAAAALLPRSNSSVAQLDQLAGPRSLASAPAAGGLASGAFGAVGGPGGGPGSLVPMSYSGGAAPQPYAAPRSSSCGSGLHHHHHQSLGRVGDGAVAPSHTSPLLSSVMPEVVVRVSLGPLPSMHQLLALLAAPLPPGHAEGRYVEVSTFTSKGPQSICTAKLAQQLSLRGVAPHSGSPLAAAADLPPPGLLAGGDGAAAAAQAALVKDVEALLGQLCWGAKGQPGVGRVVVCMRLGAAMTPEETSLVLACTGASGPAASAAVHGLVEQLALVYN